MSVEEAEALPYEVFSNLGKGVLNGAASTAVSGIEALTTITSFGPGGYESHDLTNGALEGYRHPFQYGNSPVAQVAGTTGEFLFDVGDFYAGARGGLNGGGGGESPIRKGENPIFATRRQAFGAARDRAGVPRSASPSRQWETGVDYKRWGFSNYRYSEDATTHGRYYEFTLPGGRTAVIAEHTNDGRPHFHAGETKDKENPTYSDFKNERYRKTSGSHHYYYDRRNGR